MTAADVQLLAAKLDKIDERIRMLEQEIAERRGAEEARSLTRGQVAGWVLGIAAIVGVASTVTGQILDRL